MRKKIIIISVSVILILGIVYVALLIQHGFSTRDQPSFFEAKIASMMRSLAMPAKAKAMKNPVIATAENLREAKSHWEDHCASCHSKNGSGDTEMGRNLYPKAPDMRKENTQRLSDGELYYVIQNGIRLTGMPAWGEKSDNDFETWQLVLYIRQLAKKKEEKNHELKEQDDHHDQLTDEEKKFLNN